MPIDSGYWEEAECDMNETAALLIKLYADYQHYYGCENDDYAKAVGVAIRKLSDN